MLKLGLHKIFYSLGEGGTLDNVIRYAMSVGLVNEFADLFANNPKTIDEVIAQKTSRKRASSKL